MKICIIAGLYKKHIVGGGEIYVQKIAEKLSKNNEVVIITTSPDASLKPTVEMDGHIKIYTFRPLLSIYDVSSVGSLAEILRAIAATVIDVWNPHSYKVIKDILKKERPDVIHTNNIGHVSTSTFSAIKSVGIPCIHTCHSYQLLSIWPGLFNYRRGEIVRNFGFLERRYMGIKRRLTKSVDVVTAPSKFALDMHLRHGFFKNAETVPLPVPINSRHAVKSTKNYSIIDILYIGQLLMSKGIHVLINAVKQLKQDNVRLHIVGKGAFEGKLKELAGDDFRITFHGFVPHEKIGELYQRANVIVVPSIWYENSPGVIYESFSYGTPVIGSRIGGIPELIDDSNGFLFEPGNERELKEILEHLIENPSRLKKLEEGAFESVKRFDIDKHITVLEGLYRKYAASRKNTLGEY